MSKYRVGDDFVNHEMERQLTAAVARDPTLYLQCMELFDFEAMTAHRVDFEKVAAAIEESAPTPTVTWEPTDDPLGTAKALADLHQKRLLADVGQDFLEALRGSTEVTATDLINDLEERLSGVQQRLRELARKKVQNTSDIFPEVMRELREKYQQIQDGQRIAGLPTGIESLDRALGGLQGPGLTILAGRPGVGKTSLLLQIAHSVARSGYPVMLLTCEESKQRLTLKSVAARARLEHKLFAEGQANPESLVAAFREFERDHDLIYLWEYSPHVTFSAIRAKLLQLMLRTNRDRCLLLVDYLQKQTRSRRESQEMRHDVAAVLSEYTELAKRLRIPIVLVSAQNRMSGGKADNASLSESGNIEYDADAIAVLTSTEDRFCDPPGVCIDLTITKSRWGESNIKIPLIARLDIGSFTEVAAEQQGW